MRLNTLAQTKRMGKLTASVALGSLEKVQPILSKEEMAEMSCQNVAERMKNLRVN